MAEKVAELTLRVAQREGYEFEVTFDNDRYAALSMDEPAPLGTDRGPNPARVLAAAIGDCLSASLVFCLGKSGVKLSGLTTDVSVELTRNERKRLRIGKVRVVLRPPVAADDTSLAKCQATFEDFCVVTQSVREGLDVEVLIEPAAPSV